MIIRLDGKNDEKKYSLAIHLYLMIQISSLRAVDLHVLFM